MRRSDWWDQHATLHANYLDESFEKRCDEMPASRARSQIDKMPGSQNFYTISTERFFQKIRR